MLINATQAKNNLGAYLQMVEEGEQIYIQRERGKTTLFEIRYLDTPIEEVESAKNNRMQKISKALKDLNFSFDEGESSLDFQNRVRG